jgi:hypothetical protein
MLPDYYRQVPTTTGAIELSLPMSAVGEVSDMETAVSRVGGLMHSLTGYCSPAFWKAHDQPPVLFTSPTTSHQWLRLFSTAGSISKYLAALVNSLPTISRGEKSAFGTGPPENKSGGGCDAVAAQLTAESTQSTSENNLPTIG